MPFHSPRSGNSNRSINSHLTPVTRSFTSCRLKDSKDPNSPLTVQILQHWYKAMLATIEPLITRRFVSLLTFRPCYEQPRNRLLSARIDKPASPSLVGRLACPCIQSCSWFPCETVPIFSSHGAPGLGDGWLSKWPSFPTTFLPLLCLATLSQRSLSTLSAE